MIISEKIVELRKKMNWSQEDLAEKLEVSRQSVSKWESSQSIPDMDKIVKLSTLFSVSTDYLLKDDYRIEEPVSSPVSNDSALRKVSLEEAVEFMDIRKRRAPLLSLCSSLCVVSPIPLIFISGIENIAAPVVGAGVGVILVLVAIAVTGFIRCASDFKEYEFLEKEVIETEYGVSGVVKKRRSEFKEKDTRIKTICTVVCILSVIPLIVLSCLYDDSLIIVSAVCVLLLLVSFAVHGFVYTGTINGSFDQLLEEGDYTRERKEGFEGRSKFSSIYWMVITAVFLVLLFLDVKDFWIIWPVAGVLFVPLMLLFTGRKK